MEFVKYLIFATRVLEGFLYCFNLEATVRVVDAPRDDVDGPTRTGFRDFAVD